MIYLTYGRRVVSLLTPHRLMRNCSVVLRLLLHLSVLTKAFQAFSISAPGRSSPYCRRINGVSCADITLLSPASSQFPGRPVTLAVMNMRLLSTMDVACKEPQPEPFSRCWEELVLAVLQEAS